MSHLGALKDQIVVKAVTWSHGDLECATANDTARLRELLTAIALYEEAVSKALKEYDKRR